MIVSIGSCELGKNLHTQRGIPAEKKNYNHWQEYYIHWCRMSVLHTIDMN